MIILIKAIRKFIMLLLLLFYINICSQIVFYIVNITQIINIGSFIPAEHKNTEPFNTAIEEATINRMLLFHSFFLLSCQLYHQKYTDDYDTYIFKQRCVLDATRNIRVRIWDLKPELSTGSERDASTACLRLVRSIQLRIIIVYYRQISVKNRSKFNTYVKIIKLIFFFMRYFTQQRCCNITATLKQYFYNVICYVRC